MVKLLNQSATELVYLTAWLKSKRVGCEVAAIVKSARQQVSAIASLFD
ncbi:hypothetical protein [Nostoc sp. NMS4]|nr:hypothetical protein [Nostoc sp. NMS4]MBN3924217.1 hypothetical protein [Nostoc sp. NMS4]